jgi:hypothetical protein
LHGSRRRGGDFPDAPEELVIAGGNPAPLFVVPNQTVKADVPILDQFIEMINVIEILFPSIGVDIT